jgi:uncharacterized LabA/DUF88 family protein
MFDVRKKSALLIDFDNVIGMTGGDLASTIDNWLAWLEAGGFDAKRKRRTFLSKRVYWNGMNERYRPAFEAAGFEAFACRAIAREKKSSADIVMTLDAMEVANEFRGLKEIILLTSDTDFVPVVNRLQDRKLDVVAMGNEENTTAAVYRDYADYVVLRRDLVAAFGYVPTRRSLFGRTAPALAKPVASSPSLQPAPIASKARDKLDEAAERLAQAAKGALGAPLSRQSVYRVLQSLHGFSTTGREPWFGCSSYKGLLRAIAARRRHDLRVHTYRNGGVAIAYRAPD